MLALLLSSAFAYTLADADWSGREPPIQVDFTLDPAGLPADTEEALREVVRAYNVDGAAAITVTASVGSDLSIGDDGTNAIVAADLDGAPVEIVSTADGPDLRDCDVRLDPDADPARALAWALGGCLGLGPSDVEGAVMQRPDGTFDGLSDDDVAGLQALYGPANVALARYGHAVLYDERDVVEDNGTADLDETVLFLARAVNEGDATAFGVTATLTVDDSPVRLELRDDLPDDAPAGPHDLPVGENRTFPFALAVTTPCRGGQWVDTTVTFTDARGDAFDVPYRFPIQCGGESSDGGSDWETDDGCGCATGGPASAPVLALPLLLALRRRRASRP